MSKITEKFTQLKTTGLDLGADLHPGAADMDAGYGGTYRQYQNGNIYFHSGVSPDAHEVHGGILSLFLAQGGIGLEHGVSGPRLFGYPKSDEYQIGLVRTPVSTFETGAIYWSQGTGGAVLTGAAYQAYIATVATVNGVPAGTPLGLPLTSNIAIAGGQAIFFERGVVYASDTVPNGHIIGKLHPPLLGTPAIMDPTPKQNTIMAHGVIDPVAAAITGPGGAVFKIQPSLTNLITFENIPAATYQALIKAQPTLFETLWNNRLSLINTGARNNRIQLNCVVTNTNPAGSAVTITCEMQFQGDPAPLDSTLYDLELNIAKNTGFYPLSPHSVYLKKDWTNFGILHITDLHLSLRNENLRSRLSAFNLDDAARNYANCQDQFREFIQYANHLHSIGQAHAIMATGDLVDYVAEQGDNPSGPANFERMRNMILGKPFAPGVTVGQELLIPIFTTFGNHDHRLYPYDLHCEINLKKDAFIASAAAFFIPVVGPLISLGGFLFTLFDGDTLVFKLDNYSTFNLEEPEVDAIQGTISNGKISPHYNKYDVGNANEVFKFLQVAQSYPYVDHYFGARDNKVALGPHRLVLLDSGPDDGVPSSVSPESLAKLAYRYLDGDLSPDTIELATGCPNSTGYTPAQLDLLRAAVNEAGSNGLVIVGVHLPPVAPAHGYNDFIRETEHPTADPSNAQGYLKNTGIDSKGWPLSGTPFFKTGDVEGSLSFGIGTGEALDFLKLCAGVGIGRPIDFLLCGHHHDRVEYRIRWNPATSQIEYYNDFYTENPAAYYTSTAFSADGKHNTSSRIIVGPPNLAKGGVAGIVYANLNPPQKYNTLTVPGYADPLNSSANPAAWWQAHRPVLAQTAALGPIDPRQRYTDRLADPTFQGFRLLVIRQNVINKVHYVTGKDLLNYGFVMPFEKADALPSVSVVMEQPVLQTS